MPMSATWTRGSDVVSRPLPSLVVMHTLPGGGDAEVAARDAHVGLQESLPEHAARQRRHPRGIGDLLVGGLQLGAEQACDILPALVDDGHHDVRGMVVVELNDVLAEVRFEHLARRPAPAPGSARSPR